MHVIDSELHARCSVFLPADVYPSYVHDIKSLLLPDWDALGYLQAVNNHWTGLPDWTTGLDYRTGLLDCPQKIQSCPQKAGCMITGQTSVMIGRCASCFFWGGGGGGGG